MERALYHKISDLTLNFKIHATIPSSPLWGRGLGRWGLKKDE
jgi:hypothetical protein